MRKGYKDLGFGGGGCDRGCGGWTLRVASLMGLVSNGGFDDLGWSWGRLDFVEWHELGGCFGARWAFDGLGGRRRTDRRRA